MLFYNEDMVYYLFLTTSSLKIAESINSINKHMREYLFPKDLYRYYGANGEPLFRRLFRSNEIRFLRAFRKAQYYLNRNKILFYFWEFRKRRIANKTHIQISSFAEIGEGFYIGHFGRVIINPKAVLGKNINIATGVTIGQTNRGKLSGAPTIGDNVWIGTNAVIVGKINIGTDVLIAPNAYVNFDVPDHSIVVGNPAKVIHRENATDKYIEFTV